MENYKIVVSVKSDLSDEDKKKLRRREFILNIVKHTIDVDIGIVKKFRLLKENDYFLQRDLILHYVWLQYQLKDDEDTINKIHKIEYCRGEYVVFKWSLDDTTYTYCDICGFMIRDALFEQHFYSDNFPHSKRPSEYKGIE